MWTAARSRCSTSPSRRISGIDIHVVHERGRAPGKAGRWLIEDLRQRVVVCTSHGLTGDQPAAPVKVGRAPAAVLNGNGSGAHHQPG